MKWELSDFGEAMAAHARASADTYKEHHGKLECNAFHRSGDNASSLVIWLSKGTWADARGGTGGTCKEYAAQVAGFSDIQAFMRQWGNSPGTVARPAPPARTPERVDISQVLAALKVPTEDPEVGAYLQSRGIEPEKALGLVGALSKDAKCPPCLSYGRRTWAQAGYRLILPRYGYRGEVVSYQARAIIPDAIPKTLNIAGIPTAGTTFANFKGVEMLAGRNTSPGAVRLFEGFIDFVHGAITFEGAAFGYVKGTFTQAIADRIPDGSELDIYAHPDNAGRVIAQDILKLFSDRIRANKIELFLVESEGE